VARGLNGLAAADSGAIVLMAHVCTPDPALHHRRNTEKASRTVSAVGSIHAKRKKNKSVEHEIKYQMRNQQRSSKSGELRPDLQTPQEAKQVA
jgi:hypothetical protein